ncbi:hypothetical protein TUM3792_37000 [Shewanella sp. MBTL60-007]|nr:hypothetical protein TUM3792_37000 [Shewanella sp. MBTL60-007]
MVRFSSGSLSATEKKLQTVQVNFTDFGEKAVYMSLLRLLDKMTIKQNIIVARLS